MTWKREGEIWTLYDETERGARIGWITKRNCCWHVSLDDSTNTLSFVRFDDAEMFLEKHAEFLKNGRPGRIV